jgi:hypothetical protein
LDTPLHAKLLGLAFAIAAAKLRPFHHHQPTLAALRALSNGYDLPKREGTETDSRSPRLQKVHLGLGSQSFVRTAEEQGNERSGLYIGREWSCCSADGQN